MADKSSTGAVHITTLDFDLNNAQAQLQNLKTWVEDTGREIPRIWNTSMSEGETTNLLEKLGIKEENIETAKARIQELVNEFGEFSKIQLTSKDGDLFQAIVTSSNEAGKSIRQVIDLTKELSDVSSRKITITDDAVKRQQAYEKEQQAINKQIEATYKEYEAIKEAEAKKSAEIARGVAQRNAEREKEEQAASQLTASERKRITEDEQNINNLISQLEKAGTAYQNFSDKVSSSNLSSGIKDTLFKYIEEFQLKIETLKTDLSTGFIPKDSAEQIKSFTDNLGKLTSAFEFAKKQAQEFASIQKDISGVIKQLEKFQSSNFQSTKIRQSAEELKTSFNELYEKIANGSISVDKAREQFGQLNTSFETLKDKANSASGGITNLLNRIADKAKWLIAYKMIMLVRQAFMGIVDTIKETETAVVELQRVMNDYSMSQKEVSDELYKIAYDYGQSVENVQETAVKFAQTGLGFDDVIEATRVTMLALNSAELETSTATEGLIAVMNQFNYTANDLEEIIDKINITSDKFPITSEKIVAALQRAGSTAYAYGMTLEQTIAVITALGSATGRTGETIGTALNSLITFSMKAGNLKKFEEFLGLSTGALQGQNPLAIWTALADAIDDGGEALGSMMAASEEFQELFSEEMADALGLQEEYNNTLAAGQDIYSAVGTYRQNYFIALLNNIDKAIEAMQNMDGVFGYTEEKNEKAMETLAKKWEQLVVSAKDLAVAFGEAGFLDFLKLVTEGVTGTLKLTKALGGLRTVFGLLAAAIFAVKAERIQTFLTNTVTNILSVNTSIKTLIANFNPATIAVNTFNASMAAGNGIAVSFAASIGSILGPISLLLTAVSLGAQKWNEYKESMRQARDEAIATGEEATKSAKELWSVYENFENKTISVSFDGSEVVNGYKELLKEVEEKQIDLTKTVYGNIDTNNRQVLKWTEDNIKKYTSELESWGEDTKDLLGSISTIFGASDSFDGVEIAFSPMLQTENGPVLLDSNTVYKYIYGLIDEAGKGWTSENLLQLDTEGLEIDGRIIKNLLADIGDTAIKTGEAMHYVGNLGAVASEFEEVKKLADEAGMSVDEYLKKFENVPPPASPEEIKEATKALLEYFGYQEEDIPKLTRNNKELDEVLKELIQDNYDLIKAQAEARKDALEEKGFSELNAPGMLNLGSFDDEEIEKARLAIDKLKESGVVAGETLSIFFDKVFVKSLMNVPKTTKEAEEQISELDYEINKLKNSLTSKDLSNNPVLEALIDQRNAIQGILDDFADAEADLEELGETPEEMFANMKQNAIDAQNALDDFANSAGNAVSNIVNLEEELETLNNSFEDLSNRVDSFQSAYSSAVDIINEYNETGIMTADMLQTILAMEPEYIELLNVQGNALSLNEDALMGLVDTNDVYLQQMVALKIAQEAETIATEMQAAATQGLTLAQYEAGAASAVMGGQLYQAILGEIQGTNTSNELAVALQNVGNSAGLAANWISALSDRVTGMIGSMGSLLGLVNRSQPRTYYTPKTTKSSGGSSKSNPEKDALNAEIKAWRKKKEEVSDYYDDLIEKAKKQKEESDDYYDGLIKNLKAVQEANDRINAQMDYYNSRQKIITNIEQASARSGVEWREKEMQYQQELSELDEDWRRKLEDWDIEDQISEFERLKDLSAEIINAEIENLKNLKEAAVKEIEDAIEKLQEKVSALTSAASSGASGLAGGIASGIAQAESLFEGSIEGMQDRLDKATEEEATKIQKIFDLMSTKISTDSIDKMDKFFIAPLNKHLTTVSENISTAIASGAETGAKNASDSFMFKFVQPIKREISSIMSQAMSARAVAKSSYSTPSAISGALSNTSGKTIGGKTAQGNKTVNVFANISDTTTANRTINDISDILNNPSRF